MGDIYVMDRGLELNPQVMSTTEDGPIGAYKSSADLSVSGNTLISSPGLW